MKGMNVQKCTLCVCVLTLILVCVLVFRNVNEGFVGDSHNIHHYCTDWNKMNSDRNFRLGHLEKKLNDLPPDDKIERKSPEGLEVIAITNITHQMNKLFKTMNHLNLYRFNMRPINAHGNEENLRRRALKLINGPRPETNLSVCASETTVPMVGAGHMGGTSDILPAIPRGEAAEQVARWEAKTQGTMAPIHSVGGSYP